MTARAKHGSMDTKQEEVIYEMCLTKRRALLIFSTWMAFLMRAAYQVQEDMLGRGHVTDPKCSTGVEQNQQITGSHALVGHNMSSVLVGDEFECQLKCVHTQPCKSFNVHFSSNQANKHVCELNNQTRETTAMNNNTFFTYGTSSKNSSKHVRETKTVNEKEKKERKKRKE
ncbi:hypothetical protein P5673_014831 [Acropora cervicornis]|uniref:Apple domain-containing protein n=1 Tax=Acropora cervicornis TaxID=6130 RepID=A0AAD9QJK4_ACRCE|nr:hypothetical protein P5673_014831 [Acropora cervicornis]